MPSPVSTLSTPPAHPRVNRAARDNAERAAEPLSPRPTLTVTMPPRPAVASPEAKKSALMLPIFDVPELRPSRPLTHSTPEQPSAPQKLRWLRPSDEFSARSISSSCADKAATDEHETDAGISYASESKQQSANDKKK